MAKHRHKRETKPRLTPRAAAMAAPLAALATAAIVGVGVVGTDFAPTASLAAAGQKPVATASLDAIVDRAPAVSRSSSRLAAKAERTSEKVAQEIVADRREAFAAKKAVAAADTKLWATETLNLWTSADADATVVGEIEAGDKILVTGRESNGRAEVVVEGESRWVTADYLSNEEPQDVVPGIGGTCTNGTSMSGVNSNVQKVHTAVCAAFPEISSYGGLRGGGGDHPMGRAVDIMISGDRGWQVAEFVRANASALGVSYVIYAQHIWSVERGGEGWRGMSNRGSATANHFDHVHVSTY